MNYITSNKNLAEFCQKASLAEFITLDTEFLRETTFWPKCCLIQIAWGDEEEESALIDPLAEGIDLTDFYKLLANETIVKVVHGGRQDLEIFFHEKKLIPSPLADTQIMAMVCGFGNAVGYESLVRHYLRKHIDKSYRFTNWDRRPLSQGQLDYALADVTHLRHIYRKLKQEIEKCERQNWLAEEMDLLCDARLYEKKPENGWKRLKLNQSSFLGVQIMLANWREQEAQKQNVPRHFLLRDEMLKEISIQMPDNMEALQSMRSMPSNFPFEKYGKAILEAIAKGKTVKESDYNIEPLTKKCTKKQMLLVVLLRLWLKQVANQHRVATKLIARPQDLEQIALAKTAQDHEKIQALNGWRRDIFGNTALKIKQGEVGFVYGKTGIKIAPYHNKSEQTKSIART